MQRVIDEEIEHEPGQGLDTRKAGDDDFDDDGKPTRTGTVLLLSLSHALHIYILLKSLNYLNETKNLIFKY